MHQTGRGVLGNKAASGTEIIEELGEEHQRTGKWIVYTSADSVFQIAAHVDTIPLEELYRGCEIAREILTGKHAVGRVIARPFEGEPGNYVRTPDRHDWSLKPKQPNYLTLVREAGKQVHAVGKIRDIFAGVDIDESHPTRSNVEGINQTERLLNELDEGSSSRTSSRRTCSGGTATTRSTSTAACRTSIVACPTSWRRCATGPPDPDVRSRLRPDDSVDRPLAGARPPARLRRGPKRGGTHPRR